MTAHYQISNLLKFSEEDVYSDGCQPGGSCCDIGLSFTGKTPAEVIEKVAEYLGATNEDIEKNACDEPGRVDFQIMEDENSTVASAQQIKQWKRGSLRLWNSIYTGHVEKVEVVAL